MNRRKRKAANQVALREECNQFADDVQKLAIRKLLPLGYAVAENKVNDGNHKFDLKVIRQGDALRVEVKGARLHKAQGRQGSRYQARIHNHSADIVLLYCQPPDDKPPSWFVIPMADVYPRKQITIWAENPRNHKGLWADYLENWEALTRFGFEIEF